MALITSECVPFRAEAEAEAEAERSPGWVTEERVRPAVGIRLAFCWHSPLQSY